LLKEAETSGRGTPVSDTTDSRGRRGRKPKTKMSQVDYDLPIGSKRKRGMKSTSVTPSINDNDDDEAEPDVKRRKTQVSANGGGADLPPAIRERLKKAFMECLRPVMACEDGTGRKRCELFKELPNKRDYPDYYQLIIQPISISQIKKRVKEGYYKTVQQYRDDWRLMFRNARTYNQEDSWVYVDADEMEKVFNAAFDRVTIGSDLPGAVPTSSSSSSVGGAGAIDGFLSTGIYDDNALTPMDEDDRPHPPVRGRSAGRKQVLSDEDEYLTPTDEE